MILKLRAMEPSDLDFLYNWENNEDNWLITQTLTPFSRNTLEKFIHSPMDLYKFKQQRLMIHHNESNQPIGCIDLFEFDPHNSRIGIGILIAEKVERNKGFGKIALQLAINYSRDVIQVHQLFCNILTNNHPSISLFTSCGFTQTGTKKNWIKTPQGWQDEAIYQLIL